MIKTKVYGFQAEGRSLCPSCAERSYGSSLEMYVNSGDVQILTDADRSNYASKGLICDECFAWIFEPDQTENAWWRVDPEPEEHLRLLAPFASFLELLEIDTANLLDVSV